MIFFWEGKWIEYPVSMASFSFRAQNYQFFSLKRHFLKIGLWFFTRYYEIFIRDKNTIFVIFLSSESKFIHMKAHFLARNLIQGLKMFLIKFIHELRFGFKSCSYYDRETTQIYKKNDIHNYSENWKWTCYMSKIWTPNIVKTKTS